MGEAHGKKVVSRPGEKTWKGKRKNENPLRRTHKIKNELASTS